MLLVRNRAALVIMNDCKYTSSQVTWKEHTMPRFHRVLSPFFSLHPYARFFRRGNPGEEGRFRIRSIPCRFPHLFPASVIRANFHRYRHRFFSTDTTPIFPPIGKSAPVISTFDPCDMNGRRGRGFFLEIPFRVPFEFVRVWRRKGGMEESTSCTRRVFLGSFCVEEGGGRMTRVESKREGINICEGGFSSEREEGLNFRDYSTGWVVIGLD